MSMLVRHAMTEAPITIDVKLHASDAAARMRAEDVGALPVVDGEELVGLVTDRDLVIRVVAEGRDPTKVLIRDLASESPVTIGPEEPLAAAREAMQFNKVRRLPVVADGALVGIISLGDIAWQVASAREVADTLKSVSESDRTRDTNPAPDLGDATT